MRKSVLIPLISVLSAPVLLQSCFTGVESTPKITADEVRRQQAVTTPEMEYLADVAPENFDAWLPGKAFYVTDSKIDIIFTPSAGASVPAFEAGDTLTYLHRQAAVSVTGDSVTDIVFASGRSEVPLVYRVNASPAKLAARKAVEIPFTIDLAEVSNARAKLAGKDFYILSPLWYDLADRSVDGLRFVKVRVTDVVPGNHVYPLKVIFTPDGSDLQRCVFLSLTGDESSTMRNFARLFALEDPHRRYPAITDENWDLIRRSRVALGMTRDECRLALGAPSELDRRPSTAGVYEVWNYDNGQYLIFQDGILTRFRR